MKKEDELIKEKVNDFLVRFVLNKEYNDDNQEGLNSLFGIQNEEDNVLYFYYHILDIAKGIISGSLNMYQLPKHKNLYFETHEYAYHTKELLQKYMDYLKEEIKEYDNYKSLINEIKS